MSRNSSWRTGSLILIDEPELHFHPSWQTKLRRATLQLEGLLHLMTGYGVAAELRRHLAEVQSAISRSLDEAHALVDGKWIVDVVVPESTSLSPQRCREEWIAHATNAGGLPEVVRLWERIRKPLMLSY